jgi:catechol 2,3-dioxygenase-like lactoylglutathione lyase family enzyme
MGGVVNCAGIVVANMSASLEFYRRLGLGIEEKADGQPHVEVTLDGGFRLLFDTIETIRSFDPEWQAPSGSARVSFGVKFDSPAEVDDTYEKMLALGYRGHRAPWDAFWGQRYATIIDPDENSVDLFAQIS